MAEGKRPPWLKWYPADWRSDPRLRMCSLTARGLWIELLGFMHEAEPYGHLLIGQHPPTILTIARLTGSPQNHIEKAIKELEEVGVFSRNADGVIYSRRMVRDFNKALRDKENGAMGGNPKVKGGVNPQDNPGDKAARARAPASHMPEARDNSNELSSAASAAPLDPKAWVFGELLSWLQQSSGRKEPALRSWLGKCCKQFGENAVMAAGMLVRAPPTPVDPISAMMDRLNRQVGNGKRNGTAAHSKLAPGDSTFAGFAIAIDSIERAEEGRAPRDSGTGGDAAKPLLDPG